MTRRTTQTNDMRRALAAMRREALALVRSGGINGPARVTYDAAALELWVAILKDAKNKELKL